MPKRPTWRSDSTPPDTPSDGTPPRRPQDKAVLWGEGSSDPRCVFSLLRDGEPLTGRSVKSATKKKALVVQSAHHFCTCRN